MNILLLTQVVPYPPDSGPKIKTYNVLRYLARRHAVHLVSFARSADEEARAAALQPFCAGITTVRLVRSRWRDARALLTSVLSDRPFLIERDASAAMRAHLRALCARERFDAVHADQLSMAQFALDLPVPLRVLDEHNAVWTIVQRAAGRLPPGLRLLADQEWRRLHRYEGMVCRRFDRLTVVSAEDRAALEQAAGASLPVEIIPIAVDTRALAVIPRGPNARHVVSVATMFYPPNADGVQWFAREVFPLVRRDVGEARFLIVGSRPPQRIRRLARQDSGIIVTGYLADLEPVLRQAAVMVVPLHAGSGMRVKILEAFARGIPVVSTTIGVEGIDATPGEHLLVADTPAEFARAVTILLHDPAEAARLARNARQLVVDRYDWRTALAGLDRIYTDRVVAESVKGRYR
jgi:sugar transferase (PEP-CTERM/EpsH1 system associated)